MLNFGGNKKASPQNAAMLCFEIKVPSLLLRNMYRRHYLVFLTVEIARRKNYTNGRRSQELKNLV